jgi:hypothetical protein
MRYLLDTHVVLWWLTEPKELSKLAHAIIVDKENSISVSCVSHRSKPRNQGKLSASLILLKRSSLGFWSWSFSPKIFSSISNSFFAIIIMIQ